MPQASAAAAPGRQHLGVSLGPDLYRFSFEPMPLYLWTSALASYLIRLLTNGPGCRIGDHRSTTEPRQFKEEMLLLYWNQKGKQYVSCADLDTTTVRVRGSPSQNGKKLGCAWGL